MAERRAAGFNIPLNFYDGDEVCSIPRRIRAAAVGVWALAGNYAATQLTDGYVGPELLKQFGCTAAIRAAMMVTINKKGELSPLWVDARNGGVQLTNWPKHQRTNDEVTTYRASEAERKRGARASKRSGSTWNNENLSGDRPAGQRSGVRPDDRDPKTETETETETEEPPYPPQAETSPSARGTNGAELARQRFSNIPTQTPIAERVAQAYNRSLTVPLETGLLHAVAVQITKCLEAANDPAAIAAGLELWTRSDSWSPSQIPNFVHKANNQRRTNGLGKPSQKALDIEDAAEQLIAALEPA